MIHRSNKASHRVLIIGSHTLEKDLSPLLNEYGYFVEHCSTRREGTRKFRAHKQAIVILDTGTIKHFSARLFRFFHWVRESTIILITASEQDHSVATKCLIWGAHDIVEVPSNHQTLDFTLSRVFEHQKAIIRSAFIKHAVFFGMLMLPIWLTLGFLALH